MTKITVNELCDIVKSFGYSLTIERSKYLNFKNILTGSTVDTVYDFTPCGDLSIDFVIEHLLAEIKWSETVIEYNSSIKHIVYQHTELCFIYDELFNYHRKLKIKNILNDLDNDSDHI